MKFKNSMLYLFPSVAGLLIFYLIPFLMAFYYSFINNMSSRKFIGLHNYIDTFKNQMFQKAMFNTTLFMLIGIPLLIISALLVAILLTKMLRGQTIFMSILILPIIIPSGVTAHFWKSIFDINGIINKILYRLELPIIGFPSSKWAILIPIVIYLWKNTGFIAVIFYAGLKRIPKAYYEYASCSGANSWQKFSYITCTYLSPTTFIVLILSFVNSFKIFKEIYILYGNYPPDNLYMLQHYMNNQFFSLNVQKLSSASYILFFLVSIIVFILFHRQKKLSDTFTSLELGGHIPKSKLRHLKVINHIPVVIIVIIVLIPLTFTISNSFMSSEELINRYTTEVTQFNSSDLARKGLHFVNMDFYPDNPTFEQYQKLIFNHSSYWRFYINSIMITLPTALAQCLVSCLAAYAFERMKWKYKEALFFIYVIIMMMPSQVLLLPNYLTADFLNIRDSYMSIIFPGIFNPLGVFWIRQNLRGFPKGCIEAAQSSGASEWEVFRYIVLPNLKPAIMSLFILTFSDYWNVIDQAAILIKSTYKQPLSMHLGAMLSREPGLFFAGACLYLIPAICVFFMGKNHLIDSVSFSFHRYEK